MRRDRHLLFRRGLPHSGMRSIHPRRHDRLLDQCIRAYYMNRLTAFLDRQLLQSQPDQLQDGTGILPAAVPNHPRHFVPLIQTPNLLTNRLDGLSHSALFEG